MAASLQAQKACVLWDKEYGMPVSRASAYATADGSVHSTSSDDEGRIVVDFDFDKLIISHINYKKLVVKSLPDTLFLEPNAQLLTEITVVGGEPDWVRPMLKKFIGSKQNLYGYPGVMEYDYQVQNVGTSTLYGFESKGLLRKGHLFEILPFRSVITYKDKTAGCDYSNLKNSIYHDFVTDMDHDFIREHRFYVDGWQDANAQDVVRLLFRSRETVGDSGYFCMDTVRCVILSAARYTGLEYNVKARTSPFVRATVEAFYGHKYKDWQIQYQVDYKKQGGVYYLSTCKYSNYMVSDFDRKNRKGSSFYHATSTYTARPYAGVPVDGQRFLGLPKPFAMKIIMSRKESNMEKELQGVAKEYNLY